MSHISIYFKEAWTDNTKYYLINPIWNQEQLYTYLNPFILTNFNISDFEIVEMGQILMENAASINLGDTLLEQKYGNSLQVSFYIRRVL